jgi:hypothetical protein
MLVQVIVDTVQAKVISFFIFEVVMLDATSPSDRINHRGLYESVAHPCIYDFSR